MNLLFLNLFTAYNSYAQFPVVGGSATSVSSGNAISHTVSLPSGIQEGDLLLVVLGFRDRAFNATSVSFPSGWVELVTRTETTGQGVVYYKIATATDAASSTISVGSTIDARGAFIALRINRGTFEGVPAASFN